MTTAEPTLHPPLDLLIAHAAGQADLGSRILVESHAALCQRCRGELEDLRQPGGSYLEQFPDQPLPDATWQGIFAAIPRSAAPDPFRDTPLPAVARASFDQQAQISWHEIPASPARIGRIRYRSANRSAGLILATLPAGTSLPRHHHLGKEEVVVLSGGYQDQFGHFVTGDFTSYSAGTTHRPDTDQDEDCWVIARIEGGVRLCGWRGWLQRLLSLPGNRT